MKIQNELGLPNNETGFTIIGRGYEKIFQGGAKQI